MSMEPDELYTLRNLFWLGNYQLAINEANSLQKKLGNNASLLAEKQELVYRSYVALEQYQVVLSEIKDSPKTPIGLLAIKLLATFLKDTSTKEMVLLQIQEWLTDANAANNTTLQLVAATLYLHDDNIKEAIRILHHGLNMEQNAVLVQLYLRCDRLDLAQKQVKAMKAVDEDGTLGMLATAWTLLHVNGLKAQEASYIYDELIDKFGGSSLLLNGLAVSKMHQGLFEEAEVVLLEALNKAPSDADSLANIITVSTHLQRSPEVITRYINQLKAKAPNHALVLALGTFEGAFDRVSATLKA